MRNSLKVVIGGVAIFSCFASGAQDKPGVTVTSASYGLNVSRNAAGNATAYVKSACDGKRSCTIKVKDLVSTITDPAPRKDKDFEFAYRCGSTRKSGKLDAEAADKTALLSCAD
jgi:hypothetical protein